MTPNDFVKLHKLVASAGNDNGLACDDFAKATDELAITKDHNALAQDGVAKPQNDNAFA
ncbi:MAG: hypothetical protein KJ578_04060 [Bacteroidetes bacterium]|nr:hypothetical protein [Bacteroidota bacterium]MBU1579911.1 hypothetical protein [Bacteroidota bacterium]MBU2556936.1 hypothetical protein [Bacteroidota bacterium]